jgi:hypothetical protein
MTNLTPIPPVLGELNEEPSVKMFKAFSNATNVGIPEKKVVHT